MASSRPDYWLVIITLLMAGVRCVQAAGYPASCGVGAAGSTTPLPSRAAPTAERALQGRAGCTLPPPEISPCGDFSGMPTQVLGGQQHVQVSIGANSTSSLCGGNNRVFSVTGVDPASWVVDGTPTPQPHDLASISVNAQPHTVEFAMDADVGGVNCNAAASLGSPALWHTSHPFELDPELTATITPDKSGPVHPGDTIKYTLSVQSAVPMISLVLDDHLLPGATLVPGSLSAGGTQVDASDFRWSFSTTSGSASFSATVDATLPFDNMIRDGIFVTAIPFSGAHPGHLQTSNAIPAVAAALTLKIDTPGTPDRVKVGDTIHYVLTADTSAMVASIQITDPVPFGTTLVAGSAQPAPTSSTGGVLVWSNQNQAELKVKYDVKVAALPRGVVNVTQVVNKGTAQAPPNLMATAKKKTHWAGPFTLVVNSAADDVAEDATFSPDTGKPPHGSSPDVTLRSAIQYVNQQPEGDTITFQAPGRILPQSSLDAVTVPTTIDGTTQLPGHLAEVDGGHRGIAGLQVTSSALIRGMFIHGFDIGVGLGRSGEKVLGCVLQDNVDGIVVTGSGNTIGGTGGTATRNLISGNAGHGILIRGAGANGNVVIGNYIGTDAVGARASGNGVGILVDGAGGNTIGGTAATARNVISGNQGAGIRFKNARSNPVLGNYIGTNATGTAALGNEFGVRGSVDFGMSVAPNPLGGSGSGAGNLISGNRTAGILLEMVNDGSVVGNIVGADRSGTRSVPNGSLENPDAGGIELLQCGNCLVAHNQVAGNHSPGFRLRQSAGNRLDNNLVGTTPTGRVALPNSDGVRLEDSPHNSIGEPGNGNLISGNTLDGVHIEGLGNLISNENIIQANRIGTDVSGTRALGNGGDGVAIVDASQTQVLANLISGNRGRGVYIQDRHRFPDDLGPENAVGGNLIGTAADGKRPLPNVHEGILTQGADKVKIGEDGTGRIDANTVAFNLGDGVVLEGTGNGLLTPEQQFTVGNNVIQANKGNGLVLRNWHASGEIVSNQIVGNGGSGLSAEKAVPAVNGFQVVGNTITGNHGSGIALAESGIEGLYGFRLSQNSIFQNGMLGIDLGNNGPTRNDSTGHTGPNFYLEFPTIRPRSASYPGPLLLAGKVRIGWAMDAQINASYHLEFFGSAQGNASGFGEGQTYLGAVDVTTNGTGHGEGETEFTLPSALLRLTSLAVTATATAPASQTDPLAPGLAHNTSEFSRTVQAVRGP